jgi:hypothetical protein
MSHFTRILFCSFVFLWSGQSSYAQEGEDSQTEEYVTLEEFDEAMQELDQLRLELGSALPGSTNFLISGYFASGYTNAENADSSFGASFSPVFLWTLTDKIFFEGEVEFASEGEASLDYAQLSYAATDYLTFGAGQFLSPFGTFNERVHPAWINKLPSAPFIAGHGGLSPNAIVGLQARGAVSMGNGKLNYVVFAGNGPQLNNGLAEEDEAGLLHWETGADVDNNKVIGGRVGVLPTPWLEIGASVMTGGVAAEGTSQSDVDVELFGFDITAQREVRAMHGRVRFDGEFVSSAVGDATYFPSTPEANSFENDRSGGYGQFSYRPTLVDAEILRSSEIVIRYDWLALPSGAPEDERRERWTCGLNYWLSASTVCKLAVEQLEVGDEPSANALYFQVAIGF